jgi:hypothetical protein
MCRFGVIPLRTCVVPTTRKMKKRHVRTTYEYSLHNNKNIKSICVNINGVIEVHILFRHVSVLQDHQQRMRICTIFLCEINNFYISSDDTDF